MALDKTGTYDISALLAARFQSVAAFGMNTVEEVLNADLAVHNAIVADMMGDLAESTTDKQRIYGSSGNGNMAEVDEYGLAPTQKVLTGGTVAFPLRKFQYNIGWTRDFFYTATPADLATQQIAGEEAHLRVLRREIQRAFFRSTNYTHVDHLIDNVSLGVKRLVNGDGAAIPNGPNGETFDPATHTHYNASATLTAAALIANIDDVVEHGHGGSVRTIIHRSNEAAVRALSGFVPLLAPYVTQNMNANESNGPSLDISRLDNRLIGYFHSSEVWVKPWAVANYYLSYDATDPRKPLAFREHTAAQLRGLRLAAQLESHPLYADDMEAYFGLGVWTRTNGAVLFVGDTTYADPTLN